jgi:ribosome-associated protein
MTEGGPAQNSKGASQRVNATPVRVVGEITLGQILKFSGVVSSGGEGKALIESAAVCVNGKVEQRRGRKLVPGDVVEVAGRRLVVELR